MAKKPNLSQLPKGYKRVVVPVKSQKTIFTYGKITATIILIVLFTVLNIYVRSNGFTFVSSATAMRDLGVNVWGVFGSALTSLDNLISGIGSFFDSVVNGFTTAFDFIRSTIMGIYNSVVDFAIMVGEIFDISTWWSDFWDTVKGGILFK